MHKMIKLIILLISLNIYNLFASESEQDTLKNQRTETKIVKEQKNLYQEAGFSNKIQYGQFFGLGDSDGNKYKFDYTFIFRINKHISAGPGASLEIYPTGSSTIAVPIYFDLNYNISDELYSPYLNLGTGFTIGYGYYYKLGGGLNVASSNGSYILNFGLQLDFINNKEKDIPASLGILVGLNF